MSLLLKRFWWNVGLLLLVLALMAGLWWQKQQTPVDLEPPLLTLARGEVQRIVIERNGQVLELVRQGQDWHITKPNAVVADKMKVAQLLTLLDERVTASYPVTAEQLQEFGLTPEQAIRVQFNDQVLLLGKANPVSQQRYVLYQSQIKLVSEAVYGLLLQGETGLK